LIIASRDIFEGDVVGATILGIDPAQVDYLKEFAQRHNRSFDRSTIQIRGESLESLRERLEWRFEPDRELLGPARITGLSAPYPGKTLCSGCGATLALALSVFARDNPGMDFGGAELCYGLELKAQKDSPKVFLYGDCAIKSNKGLRRATKIEGCPPTLAKTLLALMKALLSKPSMLKMLVLRTVKLVGIRLGLYHEVFPRWERYRSEEFDKSHFTL